MGFEFEAWYLLLLPLLFAAGWYASSFERRARGRDAGTVPQSVFRGVSLLLAEQPDKAIDAFIEVAKLDPELIELHHALGNLFRRRGEIERAVRIHTHLLNRADLPARERALALAELGQDYMKGGLLDRAEDTFTRLVDDKEHRLSALRALARLYQMERDWDKSIDCARRLEREAGESHHAEIAHFHCELAEQALAKGDLARAQQQLDEALAAHRRSVRATVLAGDLAAKRGEPAEAVKHWLKLESLAPDHLPLVAERLSGTLDALGRRAEAANLLRRSLLDYPSVDLLDVAFRRVGEWEGAAAGEALLHEELKRNPTLIGFERLLALRSRTRGDAELEPLRQLLNAQTRRIARYRCTKCGFRAREFHWQCIGCNHWDSTPPRRIEELDAAAA